MSFIIGSKILNVEKGRTTNGVQPVLNKYTNKPFAYVKLSSTEEISNSIQRAKENESVMAKLKPPEKAAILSTLKSKIVQNKSLLAEVICLEAGKPIATARGEVDRCIEVVSEAEREAIRGTAEDGKWRESTNASGTFSLLERRFPVGLLSFVTPFNFPLNLAMHKVAPAIAAGCPFVLKPSDQAPLSAILLGEFLSQTDMPKGSFDVLPCTLNEAPIFSLDPRIKALSFTGSPAVGWHLKNTAGRKKVLLELGGDAAVIVDKGANVNDVVSRIIFGAYGYAGQSCISVQRIIAHSEVYEQIKEGVAKGAQKLNEKKGDPTLETTLLGPVISEREAVRIESWVYESLANGAKIVTGGTRDGAIYDATLLEDVQTTDKVWQREVFGPVCSIKKFDDFKEAIDLVNQSEFGLQTGVYTSDVQKIFYSFEKLEVGGVVINDVPTTRLDTQPYGGIKSSGLGREGIRSGIEEFTEPKVLLLKNISHL